MAPIVFKWNVLNVCSGGEGFERIFIVFSVVLCKDDKDGWFRGYGMIPSKFDRAMRWGVIKMWGGSWGWQCSAFLGAAGAAFVADLGMNDEAAVLHFFGSYEKSITLRGVLKILHVSTRGKLKYNKKSHLPSLQCEHCPVLENFWI